MLVVWIRSAVDVTVDLVRGLRCPYCRTRYYDLACHVDVDHAGDDHVQLPRPSLPVPLQAPQRRWWLR